MISRYEATLNGVALSSLSPFILITDISYDEPQYSLRNVTVAKRQGARIQSTYKEKASATISFQIRNYDIRERQIICENIRHWAKNGGSLQVTDRPGQKLVCICTKAPVIGSSRNWTDILSMTFTAYNLPYWQDLNLVSASLTGTNVNGNLYVPGDAKETMVEAVITPYGTLTTVNLGVSGRTLTLSGMSVPNGAHIAITYDAQMIQSIKYGTTSLLNKRSGADDLIAQCGTNNPVAFTANVNTNVIFNARGLYE